MAMISCPECKKSISSRARKCPGCGYPIIDYIKQLEEHELGMGISDRESTGGANQNILEGAVSTSCDVRDKIQTDINNDAAEKEKCEKTEYGNEEKNIEMVRVDVGENDNSLVDKKRDCSGESSLTDRVEKSEDVVINKAISSLCDEECRNTNEKKKVCSIYMWLLLFVISALWFVGVGYYIPSQYSKIFVFLVIIPLTIFFVVMDYKSAEKDYYLGIGVLVVGILCYPIYMFVRPAKTDKRFAPAIVLSLLILANLIMILLLLNDFQKEKDELDNYISVELNKFYTKDDKFIDDFNAFCEGVSEQDDVSAYLVINNVLIPECEEVLAYIENMGNNLTDDTIKKANEDLLECYLRYYYCLKCWKIGTINHDSNQVEEGNDYLESVSTRFAVFENDLRYLKDGYGWVIN